MRGKLNVLFTRQNGSGLVGAPNVQHEFEQVMGKYANCAYAGKGFPDYIEGESMDECVQRVMPDADWVFDDDFSYHVPKTWDRKYKVAVFISDLHGKHLYGISNPVEFANMIVKAGYDAVFMRTPLVYGTSYRPEVFYEVLGDVAIWMPWSVDVNRYYRREETKYDVAFLGALNESYPLRKTICEGLPFVARGHRILCREPPYGDSYNRQYDSYYDNYIIGDKYSEALGSTRILIFDTSKYRYPILKLFEGSASGCLLMTDPPAMAKRLGFRHRDTYAEIDAVTWEDGLRYYLENPKQAKKIADRGMKMTRKYHSHDVRCVQLIKALKEKM